MSSMNNVTIIGRAVKDAQIYEKDGKASVSRFTLACRRDFKNKEGNYDSDFIEVRLIGESRANLAKMIKQGIALSVVGSITVDKYEKDGNTVYYTYVKADGVGFLPSQPAKDGNSNAATNNTKKPSNSGFTDVDVDEEELPFA